jgi:uracil-DNA glycosylase family 4
MTEVSSGTPATVAYDPGCTRCPRLAAFLRETRGRYPDYWARPVPSFGDEDARILLVGLAPDARRQPHGTPFTGDHAGILLYQSLFDAGLGTAPVSVSAADGLTLKGARIANAVKCVPPQNKPLPAEIRCCNAYLAREMGELKKVGVFLALGRVAHDAVLLAQSLPRGSFAFGHGREHRLNEAQVMIDSYHCSRYNTQTKRLTAAMFRKVLARACELAGLPVPAALRGA